MNKSMIQSGGYVLLAGLILAMSSTLFAADNNLHFSGNLLSKSCALVVDGQYLAEVRFPTVSRQDLNVAGQSARVPVVFKLKDCKGPAGYNVKVTLTGVEDSEQPGFLALGYVINRSGSGNWHGKNRRNAGCHQQYKWGDLCANQWQ
ncbi:putative fimbrial-like adhesin protein [Escherichia coli]|nr:putative fimbrial-like adhesin protein [Escherichia coli]